MDGDTDPRALLDFYLAAGADEAIGERPRNRFDEADAKPAAPATQPPSGKPPRRKTPPDAPARAVAPGLSAPGLSAPGAVMPPAARNAHEIASG